VSRPCEAGPRAGARSGDADSALLDAVQRGAFDYFLDQTNRANGLVRDKTRADWPSSIAAVGVGLTAYPVGIERGLVSRTEAAERVLTTLRFFWRSQQGPEPDATGYKGFYYHFLDMHTGARAWRCELSTIDTALLLGGMLTVAAYFDGTAPAETEIRDLADRLYARVDWRWAQNDGATVTHGWKPEGGFLPYRWRGYDEALLLYVLGLGSPTYPLPVESYRAWTSTYQWTTAYDTEYLYAGPLFTHQLSHVWIDFRGVRDAFMRARGIDYFENSRRATLVQQRYAIHNPRGRRPGRYPSHGGRRRPAILRLPRQGGARWPGRRHARSVGRDRLGPVCAGDRPSDDCTVQPAARCG
jgi:hypothetical protein